jgi:putative transposase
VTLYKNKYRVESARLKNFDYSSPGAYFITICAKNHEHLFGRIHNGDMVLSKTGSIVKEEWERSLEIQRELFCYEYTIWQSRFYEHIIRDENELKHIQEYIVNNPLNWLVDKSNPQSTNIKSNIPSMFYQTPGEIID